jgi:hypothetical protein
MLRSILHTQAHIQTHMQTHMRTHIQTHTHPGTHRRMLYCIIVVKPEAYGEFTEPNLRFHIERFYKCVRLFCLFPTSQTKSRTHACCRRPCLFHTQPNNQMSFESCVIEQAKPCAGMHTICLQHFALQHKECKSGLMGKIQKNNWTHLNNLTVCS